MQAHNPNETGKIEFMRLLENKNKRKKEEKSGVILWDFTTRKWINWKRHVLPCLKISVPRVNGP
jgi:hypothetical protein